MHSYQSPTQSYLSRNFRNSESDKISTGFSISGALRSDLPHPIEPYFSPDTRRYKEVEAQRNLQIKKINKMILDEKAQQQMVSGRILNSPRKSGFFSEFEYRPSEYELARYVSVAEQNAHRSKIEKIANGAPFATRAISKNAAGDEILGKKSFLPEISSPRVVSSARGEFPSKDKSLMSPVFRAGGTTKDPYLKLRGDLSTGLREIGRLLQTDWLKSFDSIVMTSSGGIVVRFGITKKAEAIVRYMNYMMTTNEVIAKYGLRKEVHRWGTKEGVSLCFGLHPPWAIQAIAQTRGMKSERSDAEEIDERSKEEFDWDNVMLTQPYFPQQKRT